MSAENSLLVNSRCLARLRGSGLPSGLVEKKLSRKTELYHQKEAHPEAWEVNPGQKLHQNDNHSVLSILEKDCHLPVFPALYPHDGWAILSGIPQPLL